jgi:hypothetical protein
MKFIQVRGSGDVFYWTPELEKRDDVDVLEAPDGSTPDDVKKALDEARQKLSREADLAAKEAEAAALTRVVRRTQKLDRVVPEGLQVTTVRGVDDGDSE